MGLQWGSHGGRTVWPLVGLDGSPWRTCRLMVDGSALDGLQEYLPESERRAWRSSSDDVVSDRLLSVTMATPPRGESCPNI